MDSLRQPQSSDDPLFFGHWYSEDRRRGSTSQMCLHKILTIITTIPPPLASNFPPFSGSESNEPSTEDERGDKNKGFSFDLNVGLCISPESNKSVDSGLSSGSTIALEGGGAAVRDGGSFDVNHENSCDRVENEVRENGESENTDIKIKEAEKSFGLLFEAAKLIFGELVDTDESKCEKQGLSRCSELKKGEVAATIEPSDRKLGRRRNYWSAAEMEEKSKEPSSSPIVRSKRGRPQVLPGKYRDSVLETLTRSSRTRASILPSKLRRR